MAQKRLSIEPVDTGATLYKKLENASVSLFKKNWPKIKKGHIRRFLQNKKDGTYHRTRDTERIDKINLDKKYKARDLIDILRARTFPPYSGAYFVHKGRKINLRLELSYGAKVNG